jgi:uncharacterized protein
MGFAKACGGYRLRRPFWLLALWFAVLAQAGWAQELVPVPALSQRVTDLGGALTADQRSKLEDKLAVFEREHGSQIAILIVPTTQPEDIESYSIRVAESWKVGRREIGDGVIVLVAQNDRRMHFEVAKALEGAIPDAMAKRIIAETIAPRFKEGDTYGGLDQGLDQLFRLIQGESLPPPTPKSSAGEGRALALGDSVPIVVIVAVLLGSMVLRAIFGRMVAAGATGALVGGGFWFLSGSLVIALVAAVIVFVFVLLQGSGVGRRRGFGGWGGGGWTSGGDWGGGSSGWTSGGGGDFGGGGASGSW